MVNALNGKVMRRSLYQTIVKCESVRGLESAEVVRIAQGAKTRGKKGREWSQVHDGALN
jgi:hypothetical protein